MRYLFVFSLLASNLLAQQPLDKIVIVVDREVITELQLEEDLRVTAFLNEVPVRRDPPERRASADRLISQAFIAQDMRLARQPVPDQSDIDQAVDNIREALGTATFDARLHTYQLSQADLRHHLALQIAALRFTAFRFRPEVGVSEDDIEDYYHRESRDRPAANLPASRESIRRVLIEQRTSTALTAWLSERRKQVHIVYMDADLQSPQNPDPL